jgi:hypothetical protein
LSAGDGTDPLHPGDSLTSWRYSDPEIRPFPGAARPMPHDIDYHFANDWRNVGDLPCREALRALLPSRAFRREDCAPLPHLHAGGEDPNVDFSTFRFTPDLIARWASAEVIATAPVSARFRVWTCGGLRLWAGETEALVFEPFTRNTPQSTEVVLDFPTGATTLTLRFDDLHERDTTCFFRVTLIEGEGLSTRPPSAKLRTARRAMDGLKTDRIVYRGGDVQLLTDAAPSAPLELTLRRASETVHARAPGRTAKTTLATADAPVALIPAGALPPGCIALDLVARVDGADIARGLGTTIYPDPPRLDAPGLGARKVEARRLIAASASTTPSRALVLCAEGRAGGTAALLEAPLTAIEARHDCADFAILPILRLWRDYGESLPKNVRDRMERALLGFRYWLDEPGNDVMWFWSENHALCFHAAQHVAGELFPDRIFPNSGRSGAAQAALGAMRLGRWFDTIERQGYGEWTSAAYYPIDLLGLLTLADMSPDAEIAARARAQCDALFAMTALHRIGGTSVGSQGRAYEKELFAGAATELAAMSAIGLGGPFMPGFDRPAGLFALSDYAPPEALRALAEVPPGRTLTARYTQGLDHVGKLTLWKSDAALLSSVTGLPAGTPGHQQHIADLAMAADPFARVWVNHPGELKPWGGGRPSFWAGNGLLPASAQEGNVVLLVYNLAAHPHPVDFTHALVPAEVMDEVLRDGLWLFARKGEGYAALWASGTPERHEAGLYAGSEWRLHAPRAGWVMVAGAASLHGSFSAFCETARRLAPAFDPATLRLAAGDLALSFDGTFEKGGRPMPFAPLSITPHIGWDGAEPAPFS